MTGDMTNNLQRPPVRRQEARRHSLDIGIDRTPLDVSLCGSDWQVSEEHTQTHTQTHTGAISAGHSDDERSVCVLSEASASCWCTMYLCPDFMSLTPFPWAP